ncbi:hypothetical protein ACQ4PT_014936 [Festuca glaucescens]
MVLRSLVAKMRNPVSAALRLPPLAPRAGARLKFYSSAKGKEPYSLKINIHSASQEELLNEALCVREQIDEIWELVSKEKEKVPMVWQDMRSTAKLVIGACILANVISYATYEDDLYEDDPTAESEE